MWHMANFNDAASYNLGQSKMNVHNGWPRSMFK